MKAVCTLVMLALVMGACGDDEADVSAGSGAPGLETTTTEPAAHDAEGSTAVWSLAEDDPPAADAETFVAMVTRLECSDGETGKVLEPVVAAEAERIVVTFAVEPLPPGAHTCPGNDQVPYVVELGQRIGDRELVDGACLVGEAASTSFCIDGPVRWRP